MSIQPHSLGPTMSGWVVTAGSIPPKPQQGHTFPLRVLNVNTQVRGLERSGERGSSHQLTTDQWPLSRRVVGASLQLYPGLLDQFVETIMDDFVQKNVGRIGTEPFATLKESLFPFYYQELHPIALLDKMSQPDVVSLATKICLEINREFQFIIEEFNSLKNQMIPLVYLGMNRQIREPIYAIRLATGSLAEKERAVKALYANIKEHIERGYEVDVLTEEEGAPSCYKILKSDEMLERIQTYLFKIAGFYF